MIQTKRTTMWVFVSSAFDGTPLHSLIATAVLVSTLLFPCNLIVAGVVGFGNSACVANETFQANPQNTIQDGGQGKSVEQESHSAIRRIDFVDLEIAIDRSRITGQPILVLFHAPWCEGCKLLQQEFQAAEFQSIAGDWNLVSVDVDRNPERAEQFHVGVVPTLFVLDPAGHPVANQPGFVEAKKLVRWMETGRKLAVPDAPDVLIAMEAPTKTEIKELIELLADANPEIREIAIERLAAFPEKTREPVVDGLTKATLASRLAMLDLLSRWQAPIDGVDAWDWPSFTPERAERLNAWRNTPIESLSQPSESLSPDELIQATASLSQYLVDGSETDRLLPRFSKYGKLLLPAIYERLEAVDDEGSRQKLLALRYWLCASNRLRLAWRSGFFQLGSPHLDLRREAVRQLLIRADGNDVDLLLELFSDSDPLIRELSLRGLNSVGAKQTDEALVRLLKDPDLNVRAAVLKQLAEEKSERMVPYVAEYLEAEKDSDLIVHGLRYFKVAAKSEKQLPVLDKLSTHESWQVRAMVAEVLGELASNSNTAAVLKVSIGATLLRLIDDQDGFVTSRAVDAMPAPKTDGAMERLAAIAMARPELAEKIVAAMTKDSSEFSSGYSERKISPDKFLQQFLASENPKLRVAGVTGLSETSIAKLDYEKLLADSAADVRIAAAKSLLRRLDSVRDYSDLVSRVSASENSLSIPVRPKSFLQSFLEGFRGESTEPVPEPNDESADVQPNAETDPDAEPLKVENSGAETKPDGGNATSNSVSRLPKLAVEIWIDQWSKGEIKRPGWALNLPPLLRKMTVAEDRSERASAFKALIALQPDGSELESLYNLAQSDAGLFADLIDLFQWLPFEQRSELLDWMLDQKQFGDALNAAVTAYGAIRNPAAADKLWTKVNHPRVKLHAAQQALISAYFGESASSYSSLEDDESTNKYLLADAVPRISSHLDESANSTAAVRQLALVLLYATNRKSAIEQTEKILKDASQDEATKVLALRIKLMATPASEFAKVTVGFLSNDQLDSGQKRTAVRALAFGQDTLREMQPNDALQIPYDYRTSMVDNGSDAKLRAPKAPEGLTRPHIESLLSDPDPETRALATYFSILLSPDQSLAPLIDFWSRDKKNQELARLVVDAISVRGDDSLASILSEIFELHGSSDDPRFASQMYWTIRSMRGPAALKLRQRIRSEIGMDRLNN